MSHCTSLANLDTERAARDRGNPWFNVTLTAGRAVISALHSQNPPAKPDRLRECPLSLAGSLPEPRFRTRGPWCDLDRWEAAATEKGLVARRFGFERKSASFAPPITPSTSSNPYFSINLRPNQLALFGHGSITGVSG